MKQIRFFDPKTEVNFVKYFKPALFIAALIPTICVVSIALFGINWGIDFTGGTELQVQFQKDVPAEEIRQVLEKLGFSKHQVQTYGSAEGHEMLIRVERLSTFKPEDVSKIEGMLNTHFAGAKVSFSQDAGDRLIVRLPAPAVDGTTDVVAANAAVEAEQQQLAKLLDEQSGFHLRRTKRIGEAQADIRDSIARSEPTRGLVTYTVHFMGVSDKIGKALSDHFGKVEIRRVEFVDSQVSKQLRTDGALAVLYALLAITVYIVIRFSYLFSPGAMVALVQDTFGAMLVFVFGRYEFDLPSVAALLTIVGVSINNTVVVYDRIRETLPAADGKKPLSDEQVVHYVNKAVNDTLSRTINTTMTTLFASVSLWLLAGGVIKSFALVLTVGLALGAFSSTFAAPAAYLFMWRRFAQHMVPTRTEGERGLSREDKARGVV